MHKWDNSNQDSTTAMHNIGVAEPHPTGVAPLVEHSPMEQKVTRLIPSQDTCLVVASPWLVHVQEATN